MIIVLNICELFYDLCIVINVFNRSVEIVIIDVRFVMGLDYMNVCFVSRRMFIIFIYKFVLCVVKITKRRGYVVSVTVMVSSFIVFKNGINWREC